MQAEPSVECFQGHATTWSGIYMAGTCNRYIPVSYVLVTALTCGNWSPPSYFSSKEWQKTDKLFQHIEQCFNSWRADEKCCKHAEKNTYLWFLKKVARGLQNGTFPNSINGFPVADIFSPSFCSSYLYPSLTVPCYDKHDSSQLSNYF